MSRTSSVLDLDGRSSVSAVLGPTNTGKTHRAIERMLQHRTGMIGLPLRLLAREVYERVVARKGAELVALVTGEEKIVPAGARYWVCTVEAMPLERPVAFLAVDEIQLAADRHRGHVFTDRILHARGLRETMFLGSDTVAARLQELVPTVRIDTAPRLSRLSYTGPRKLTALPPRSAVVAFSADRVYALAERIRRQRGGAAVVLGALSPRARNAQVAMYQSGEVPYLVATDAIGMGLNMDVDHVAFTELHKFDGRRVRRLSDAEMAQIAGRAGRFRRDGTFGPTTDLGALEPEVVEALEGHRFPPLERLSWRNSRLDTSSVDALLDSLAAPPPAWFLVPVRDGDDHRALEDLARDERVRAAATDPDAVALLWDVCQIPDYRKTLTGSHAELLARIFLQLRQHGRLDDDDVARRIERLDDTSGDIDVLMARIAYVRTWTYISFRSSWLRDARHWQERTRAIEDALSDALHAQLTARFVDERAMAVVGRPNPEGEVAFGDDGVVRIAGQTVGALQGFSFRAQGVDAGDKALRRAVRGAVGAALEGRANRLLRADDAALSLDGLRLAFSGEPVAHLVRGSDRLRPEVRMPADDLLPGPIREDVRQRLLSWVHARVDALVAPLRDAAEALSPAARGLLFLLETGLGTVSRAEAEGHVRRLTKDDRRDLAARGVRIGTESVYAKDLLRPDAVRLRLAVAALDAGVGLPSVLPTGGTITVPVEGAPGVWWRSGFVPVGSRAVRADLLEKLAFAVRKASRDGDFAPDPTWASWLGVSRDALADVVGGLGFAPAGEGRFRRRRARRR